MHADARGARVLLWHLGRMGAGAKFTVDLARELRSFPDMDIAIACSRGSDLDIHSRALLTPVNAVTTFRGNNSGWRGRTAAALGLVRLPLLARSFRRILIQSRIDVAVCTMPAVWDLAMIAALSRVATRSVLILHDAFLHPGDEYHPLRQTFLHHYVRKADALIVLSEHVREQTAGILGYPLERIWKMQHGAFAFGEAIRPASHPNGTRRLRILFFGRIVAYKGLDHLLGACRVLQQRDVPVDLTIAGSGSLGPYAEHLDGLSGVEVHNRWVNDAEITSFMARSDAVVLPYIEASQSGVAAVAYAAGRPVVATPAGGLTEQIVHGKTGLIARDMSVGALADAIQSLAVDPDLLDRCAAGAFAYAQDELSWRRSAEVVAEVVSTVRKAQRHGTAGLDRTG